MSDAQQKALPTEIPSELPIHFIKGNHFRVVHASGVWFGADPQGNVHLTFYNERTAIPQKIIIKIDQATGLFTGEDESKRESKEGIVREMEVDIILSPIVAQGIFKKLQENITAAAQAQELSSKSGSL